MNQRTLLCLFLFLGAVDVVIGQEQKRGTIKVKKAGQTVYLISKATTQVVPQNRVFRVRFYNFDFKEYFPKEYKSDLFPLVFNRTGLILADEKMQWTNNVILSYDYELFKTQVQFKKGNANSFNLTVPLRELSYMMNGSSLWIKNLVYKDQNGVIHENEIGEFKIEKVK